MTWDEAVGDNVGVEFHDSMVVAVDRDGSTLVIRLSPAWVHRSAGELGRDDPGTQWNQDAILRLDEARGIVDSPEFPGSIINGDVTQGDRTFSNLIPAPIDLAGEVLLSIDFNEGTTWRVSGSRFRLDLEGEPELIDVWPPA